METELTVLSGVSVVSNTPVKVPCRTVLIKLPLLAGGQGGGGGGREREKVNN